MVEIRTPQKQSYINKPIGVSRASDGSAQLAQTIARGAASYAQSITNTVNSALSAATSIQEGYEFSKYVDWARSTPILDEQGKPKKLDMPFALGRRTQEQVNNILIDRYSQADAVDLDKKLVAFRNDPNLKYNSDEFNKVASSYIKERAEIISKSGSVDYSQSYLANATATLAKHTLDISSKNAARQEQQASLNFITTTGKEADNLFFQVQDSGGNYELALEELDRLRSKIKSDVAIQNGMTVAGQIETLSQLDRGFAEAVLLGKLGDGATSAQVRDVEIALRTGKASDQLKAIIPEFDSFIKQYLPNRVDREALRANFATYSGDLSQKESTEALINSSVTGVGKPAQKKSSAILNQQFNINNETDFLSAISDETQRSEVLTFMQRMEAAPSWLVTTMEGAANGNTPYSPEAIMQLGEVAFQLMYTPNGRLIHNGRGMDAETVSFVKSLQALRTRFSDKNAGDIMAMAQSAHNSNPVYRDTIASALGVTNSAEGSPTQWIKSFLKDRTTFFGNKVYNPQFIDRFAPVFGKHLMMNGKSDALDFLDEFYDSFNHEYEYSYVPEGGDNKQPYTPEYYFNRELGYVESFVAGSLHGKVKRWKLDYFEQTVNKRLQQLETPLELGDDVLLESDPRNNEEFGTFWAVGRDGNRIKDSYGNDLYFTTKSINARTVIEDRRIAEEEAREAAIAEEQEKIKLREGAPDRLKEFGAGGMLVGF